MITINIVDGEPLIIPVGAVRTEIDNGVATVYFAGDREVSGVDFLDGLRRHIKIKVKKDCAKAITEGFISGASGIESSYRATLEDQVNIISSALARVGAIVTRDTETVVLTPVQISNLNADMVARRDAILADKGSRDAMIDRATSEAEIESIAQLTW